MRSDMSPATRCWKCQETCMFDRRLPMLLLIGLALPIVGCSTASVTALQVSPSTATAAVGQTVQFMATATYNQGSHPGSNQNATDSATWSSSNTSVATINSSGVATAVGAGTTVITASISGYPGLASSTAQLSVTGTGRKTRIAADAILVLRPVPLNSQLQVQREAAPAASFRSLSYLALNLFLRQ